jgi:LPS sulfotransferase NodH
MTDVIVSSSGRKGTFMLLTALECHPDIFVHSQIFSAPYPEFLHGASGREAFERSYSREFLGLSPETTVILPASPTMQEFAGFWDAAFEHRQLRIVHLRRRNMLRWYVSEQVARQTGVWSSRYSRVEPEPPVVIDPKLAASFIFWDLRAEDDCIDRFRKHAHLEIWYEDFAARSRETLDQVQDFLGVDVRALRSATRKQSTRAVPDAIANYDELVRAWQGTDYAKYLD